jgi:hypothetical protein
VLFDEPVFKTKQCGKSRLNESNLLIHIHSHMELGKYTDSLRVDSLFWRGG